jgi:hypothetical protein
MTQIGISPDEAHHGFDSQATHTDTIRSAATQIGHHIESLAYGTYKSATTMAMHVKWESEVKPRLDALCQESDEKRDGGQHAVQTQQAHQQAGADAVQSA